jgi:hypothetical protein
VGRGARHRALSMDISNAPGGGAGMTQEQVADFGDEQLKIAWAGSKRGASDRRWRAWLGDVWRI